MLPDHASFVVLLIEGQHKEVFAVLNGFAGLHKDKVLILAGSAASTSCKDP